MTGRTLLTLAVVLILGLLVPTPAPAAPEGQLTWAVHVSLAPTWFDPAETTGIITPFLFLYAIHDALVKPMPGNPMAPSLAESWTVSADQRVYEFKLREGVKFHNGDPVTAEDVKFSLERYRGAAAGAFKSRIASVDALDAQRIRFTFKQPWPDFMTFYGTLATGAGWIVPKKYVERVGDDGFKKAPVGAGPYKFVSFTPGVELVLEANEQYWRKSPSVKRLVLKVVPKEVTRLAMLKRGEVDIAYAFRGPLAEDLRRTPGLTLKPVQFYGDQWLLFTDQTEAIANYLAAVGIRTKIRTLERAAYFSQLRAKKLRPLVYVASAAYGNAATRLDSFVAAGGLYTYGSYPDIEGLVQEQASERDRKRREATLHGIQQLMHERAMFAPIWDTASLTGYGPRVAEPGLGLIGSYLFSAPYEDVKLKGR